MTAAPFSIDIRARAARLTSGARVAGAPARAHHRKLAPTPVRILERIVSGGAAGRTPEETYVRTWGADYHPLAGRVSGEPTPRATVENLSPRRALVRHSAP